MLSRRRCALVLILVVGWSSALLRADQERFFAGLAPVRPDAAGSLKTAAKDWYKDAVVYHLWVGSFRDSDNDGVGDLKGIIAGLGTLKELGVNCLWLSPFCRSSSNGRNLHGYDVVDHYSVDPRLGNNEDARSLVREAHVRGIRVIFDFVPNHVSSRHPWFIESRDRNSPKRDWFVWRDTRPEKGWSGTGGRSCWQAGDGAYYYAVFGGGMPDMNHRNAEARLEMAKAARHWLDLGFDGLRVDSVRYLYENLEGAGEKSDREDRPETIAWFENFRREVLDPYDAPGYAKFMVAENWTGDRSSLLRYMGDADRPAFHMTFDFALLGAFTKLNPALARELWTWDAQLPAHAWRGTFVSNHDLAADRPGTLFANQPQKLRAQTAWLLLGPGTPFIYYGNEIAQPQGPERGDTKHRKPLDWAAVKRQQDEAGSMWRWHQQLIRLRAEHVSIRRGKANFLQTTGGERALAVWRTHGDDTTLTIFNTQDVPLDSLVVTLPAGAGQGDFVLGSGPPAVGGAGQLEAGAFASFETKVVRFK